MASRRHGFAQRRRAVGFTQESFAERLGVERSTVVRWEAGETEPQPSARPTIARVLCVSLDRLDELLDVTEQQETDTNEQLDYALENPSRVDLVAVAHLRQRVQDIDLRYDREPSTSLLADAGQCLGQVIFLRTHAATNRMRHELYGVEAEAAILMGQLVWDASRRRDHVTARTYFDQAVQAARQLRALTTAEGLAYLRTSYVALYGEKDPKAGLMLTIQAAETIKDSSAALSGLAVAHAAEAHAMLGQERDCERALAQAESYFGKVDADDPAIDLFSPTQHGRLAGSCYLFLDNAERAQPILEQTAQSLQDRSKSQAIVLGNLALSYIRQRKLDEATGALHRAMDVVEVTWGGGASMLCSAPPVNFDHGVLSQLCRTFTTGY